MPLLRATLTRIPENASAKDSATLLLFLLLAAVTFGNEIECSIEECTDAPAYPPVLTALEGAPGGSMDLPYAPSCKIRGLIGKTLRPKYATGFSIRYFDKENKPVNRGGWNITVSVKNVGDIYHANVFDIGNGIVYGYVMVWTNPRLERSIEVSILIEGVAMREKPFVLRVEEDPTEKEVMIEQDDRGESTCKELVVVTGADAGMFDRIENLVGSIHWWQKGRARIVVYDFGFEPEDVEEIKNWRFVKYRRFPCEDYPPHVCRMGSQCSYAFKAFVLDWELQKNECVLWLDSGIEVRNNLDSILDIINRKGHFYVTNGWQWPNKFVHPDGLAFWGKTNDDFRFDGEVHLEAMGGIQGYKRGSLAHREILPLLTSCAMEEKCVAPPGTNRENYRQDQTVLNICTLSHPKRQLFRPEVSKQFWSVAPADEDKLSHDETQLSVNNITLFIRRGFTPRPYFLHVLQRDRPLPDEL